MKVKIRNLDPTGVEVEGEEFVLPVLVDPDPRAYKEVVQKDGTVITYEPAKQNRYFLDIGEYTYRINDRTGELTLITKHK